MSARDKLRACFPGLPPGESNALIEAAVDEILNDHAHELAEKQRKQSNGFAALRSERAQGIATGLRMGADLIDPETKR